MEFTIMELIRLGAPVLAIGGAWQGAKVALNGTRQRVKKLETDLESHKIVSSNNHIEAVDRLARIETKIDAIVERK